MKDRLTREAIALRAAREFFDGAAVNLGGGIPALAANFVPEGKTVIFHTENGALGFGPVPSSELETQPHLMGASGLPFIPLPGMCFFDHATSFGMIRGGHIDMTVLGALQVSEKGDLANWTFPKRGLGNIGGGMDLAFGCRKVIVTMEHVTPNGALKILTECTYPITAPRCVSLIVTDIAVMNVSEIGLVLEEVAPGWTAEEVQALTEPKLIVAEGIKEMQL
jgi:3-oxoacid CoA-transferase subunit B